MSPTTPPLIFSLSPIPHASNYNEFHVNLDPSKFDNLLPEQQLNIIKEKWIINLSSVDIPTEIQYLLQLGEKFSLPTESFRKHDFINFIKQLENNLFRLPPNTVNDIRIFSVHELSRDTVVSLLSSRKQQDARRVSLRESDR